MPKIVKGDPLGFPTSNLLQNIKNIEGDPLKTSKNFRKNPLTVLPLSIQPSSVLHLFENKINLGVLSPARLNSKSCRQTRD